MKDMFKHSPGDWVFVTFAQVNFRGRVIQCRVGVGGVVSYYTQYADDRGDLKFQEFYDDEVSITKDLT